MRKKREESPDKSGIEPTGRKKQPWSFVLLSKRKRTLSNEADLFCAWEKIFLFVIMESECKGEALWKTS